MHFLQIHKFPFFQGKHELISSGKQTDFFFPSELSTNRAKYATGFPCWTLFYMNNNRSGPHSPLWTPSAVIHPWGQRPPLRTADSLCNVQHGNTSFWVPYDWCGHVAWFREDKKEASKAHKAMCCCGKIWLTILIWLALKYFRLAWDGVVWVAFLHPSHAIVCWKFTLNK